MAVERAPGAVCAGGRLPGRLHALLPVRPPDHLEGEPLYEAILESARSFDLDQRRIFLCVDREYRKVYRMDVPRLAR